MNQFSNVRFLFVPLAMCVLFLASWPGSVAARQKISDQLARKIDAAVEVEIDRQHVIGAAVGLVQNGRLVYTSGYGLADRESRTPVTRETVFSWASNSKPLIAVVALKLVEQGKLDLDADVRQYVPEFPAKTDVVTPRLILCHQSGIPHYSNGVVRGSHSRELSPRMAAKPVLCIKRFDESPLLFAPGEKASYSSYAFILLSAVVERAGGKPIEQLIDEIVVTPLDMKSFTVDSSVTKPGWAEGYVQSSSGKIRRAAPASHQWKHGAGAYKSNIDDFGAWCEALVRRKILTGPSYDALLTPQKLNNGTVTDWGLGLSVTQQNGQTKLSHNGRQDEARTRLVGYTQSKSGVVVMSNCRWADPGKISTAVYGALR